MAEIDEEIGQSLTLRKVTKSIDGLGHLESESTTDVTIKGLIQPITEKDKDILATGNIISGDVKMYCKHTYTCSGTDYTVEPGDIIIDMNNTQWRVNWANTYYWGESAVYRKCHLRRITTE